MVRRCSGYSAYFARDGSKHQDVAEYLIREVREAYALGEVSDDELDERMHAAVRGDWQGAGYQFGPPLMDEVIYR